MTMSRLRTLLTTVVVAMLVAAGCGGTSEADYRAELQETAETLEERFEALGAPGSGEASADDFRESADALEAAADDFDDIDPPDEVADAHDDLVVVLRDLAGLIDRMADLLDDADGDTLALATLLQEDDEFRETSEALNERMAGVFAAFDEAGYGDLFGPGDDAPADDAPADLPADADIPPPPGSDAVPPTDEDPLAPVDE